MINFKKEIDPNNNIKFVNNWLDQVFKSEIIIILTKWEEYERLNYSNF